MTEPDSSRRSQENGEGEGAFSELEAWRVVRDRIRLEYALADWVSMLQGRDLPVLAMAIRSLDPDSGRAPVIEAWPRATRDRLQADQITFEPDELVQLAEALSNGVPVWSDARGLPPAARLLLDGGDGSRAVLVALQHASRFLGVLVISSRHGSDRFIDAARAIAAPAATALELALSTRALNEIELTGVVPGIGGAQPDPEIIGNSAGLTAVMEQVSRVAGTEAPVLILGETGAGKEMIARAIHRRSTRADGPIVRVNCGAIPTELIDSELFGHERGAFTGALATRRGWFERADGGTLFLDEIGELPLPAQVRLLRVLQDGTFQRVGGQKTLSASVRIVAATHRDLPTMITDGRFREDLWYRISVFPIRLPPLRERMDDLPALAKHFARTAGARLGTTFLEPTHEDLALLRGYHWPGNVRELGAVIERAAILGRGRHLSIRDALSLVPVPAASAPPVFLPVAPPASTSPAGVAPVPTAALDAAIIREIENALTKTGGRIEGPSGAAAALGINPHTLRSRMRKLGLDWQRFRR